jgi:hypothetical protein
MLAEAGYDDEDNPAPEVIQILAQHAQKSPAGMALWLKVTNQETETTDGKVELQTGETCPHCGQMRGEDFVTANDGEAAYLRIAEFRDISPVDKHGFSRENSGQQPPAAGA